MGHWPAWGALTWSPCFHGWQKLKFITMEMALLPRRLGSHSPSAQSDAQQMFVG